MFNTLTTTYNEPPIPLLLTLFNFTWTAFRRWKSKLFTLREQCNELLLVSFGQCNEFLLFDVVSAAEKLKYIQLFIPRVAERFGENIFMQTIDAPFRAKYSAHWKTGFNIKTLQNKRPSFQLGAIHLRRPLQNCVFDSPSLVTFHLKSSNPPVGRSYIQDSSPFHQKNRMKSKHQEDLYLRTKDTKAIKTIF